MLCEVCLNSEGSYCNICHAYICEECKFKILPRARTALKKLVNKDYRLGFR